MGIRQQSDINDFDTYNGRMDRSINDKMFFVDKIGDPDLIVDYGCGRGTLLREVKKWFPNTQLLGFDIEQKMIDELEANSMAFIEGTTEWSDVEEAVSETEGESAIVLSSIIHEVYHYSDVDQIDEFWNRIWNSGFDYIVLRDMIPSNAIDRRPPRETVRKVYSEFGESKELKDFENIWGKVGSSYKQLVHFLLKYRYTEPNWEREVKENYFPFYVEDLMTEIPDHYSILFDHHYVLPFLKQQIRSDFRIELSDPTHYKLILENR